MGELVIAVYRPRKGKAAQLAAVVRDHVPELQRLKLATSRTPVVMRAKDGSILEVFEWVSRKAVEKAHHHPAVMKLWDRFDACSTFETLGGLGEAKERFPHFEPVKGRRSR